MIEKPSSSEVTWVRRVTGHGPGQPAQEHHGQQDGCDDEQAPTERRTARRTAPSGASCVLTHPLSHLGFSYAQPRGAPAHACPRPPRRRVEQGRRVDRDVRRRRASTSTSPPAPAASAARSSTRRWTAPTSSRTSPRSAARRWSGPATSSASARTGWASSTPAGPRATRSRRCPRAASALVPLEEAAAPLVQADPRVPAARDDDVRRARWLPAPRPHQVPRDLGRGVRGRGRPGALPGARRAVAGRSSSTTTTRSTRPGSRRLHDAMVAHGLESPWAERLAEWKDEPEWDARVTTRVPVLATTSGSATRRCSRTPRRSTRTASGSRSRASSRPRSGRPRTSSW